MQSPRSRRTFAPIWFRFRIPFGCSLLLLLAAPVDARAQDEAVVDLVANVLAAEDARWFDEALLSHAASYPEPVVRRYAALAMGRIGNPAATPLLLPLLSDPDSSVAPMAAFALGLIRDRTAIPPLRELVLGSAADTHWDLQLEAVSAIARIGGPDAATFLQDFLVRWMGRGGEQPASVLRALWESWRLGLEGAPLPAIESFASQPSGEAREAALYSLTRLHAPAAASLILSATTDDNAYMRELAARTLTRAYVDSAGLDPQGVATRVSRLIEDPEPLVRIMALRALATFRDPGLAAAAASRATDPEPNVRVEALTALGALGGPTAAATLRDQVTGGIFATRRQALLGLARVDRAAALLAAAHWITTDDPTRRMVGAQVLGIIGGDTAEAWLEDLLHDEDGRVVGRAYAALLQADSVRADGVAHDLLRHPDPVVRTSAANRLRMHPSRDDVTPLADAFARAQDDSIPDAQIAALRALAAVAELDFSSRVAVEDAFLKRFPVCANYLVRRAAQDVFPAAAQQWGPATPLKTGRGIGDYRDLARHFIVPGGAPRGPPRIVIETERGRLEIELYAADAPVTVNSLLQLVDRRFFDGGMWHRVVPGFVIQDGDPRGDGWGGPGYSLRDEVSLRRYERGTVGMALSGPDTGGSQFFITLERQPHLDGTYPVIGHVVSGAALIDRITLGERIRTIRRR